MADDDWWRLYKMGIGDIPLRYLVDFDDSTSEEWTSDESLGSWQVLGKIFKRKLSNPYLFDKFEREISC